MSKYAIAGKQFMKGNIGNAITALRSTTVKSELISTDIHPARYHRGNFFFGVNGADKAFIWGNYNSSLTAYQKCPIVSAVINKSAQATVNGKMFIMNSDGKESQKPQAKALRRMFMRPNPLQTGKQFQAQGNVYKRMYGYCPILVMRPKGFEHDFSTWIMFNVPPWMIQVEDDPNWFFTSTRQPFKSIRLTYMGRSVLVNPDNLFFLKENQVSTSTYHTSSIIENVSLFLPDSKLLYLEKSIDTLVSSLEGRASLNRDRGPMWLLTNDSGDGDAGIFPVDEDDKTELQREFLRYGVMNGQRKAIITDAKLKLQTVGFDVAQLKLLEGEIQDAKMICDGLNFPPYLLGLVDAKFDNQQIAERNWYTNSVIPDAESDDEQWNEFLKLDEIGLSRVTDYTHLPALQEDDVKRSTARLILDQALKIEYDAGVLTLNEWLLALGKDPIGPEGDVRATDIKNTNAPLATIIGVGGIQSLLGVLTASGLSEEARANTLQIIFGISAENAAAMVVNSNSQTQSTESNGNGNQAG